ncbi:hypothetical protein FXN59_08900 [Aggregatibacter actinomycetemcomitans]|nr:hypothetical protein FXN59_08900 [Aggregatibacter actinomycetemcomitans]
MRRQPLRNWSYLPLSPLLMIMLKNCFLHCRANVSANISAMCGYVLFNRWRMTGLFRSAPVINKPPMPTIICARF